VSAPAGNPARFKRAAWTLAVLGVVALVLVRPVTRVVKPARAGVRVVLWHSQRGPERQTLERLLRAFNAQHDGRVYVEPLGVPEGSFKDKLVRNIPRGSGPDLFIRPHNEVGELHAERVVGEVGGEELYATYPKKLVDGLSVDQRHFGLPLTYKGLCLFYNRDLLPDGPPRDAAELAALRGKLPPGTFPLAYDATDFFFHAPFFIGAGERIFGGGDGGRLRFAVFDRDADSSFRWPGEWRRAGLLPPEPNYNEAVRLFQAGQAATIINGHLVLLLASAAVLYPVLWVLKLALTPGGQLGDDPSVIPLPSRVDFANFGEFLGARDFNGQPLFLYQLGNSLLVSLTAAIVGVVFALTAAYGFSRFAFVGQKAGPKAMLISQMFPAVVTAVPLLFILDRLRLFGTTAGLVLIYATGSVPFCIWQLKGFFDTLPRDLEESARLDGAGHFTIFRKIMLPLVRPGIAVTALFSFMTGWNEFIMASLFLDDATKYTLPVTLQQLVGGYDPNWGAFAAGSLVLSLPVVVVFFFVQRHLVAGLTAGAVKG
jgi:arabinogalactan oligomer/maltooligosaccharide transport system permease protein